MKVSRNISSVKKIFHTAYVEEMFAFRSLSFSVPQTTALISPSPPWSTLKILSPRELWPNISRPSLRMRRFMSATSPGNIPANRCGTFPVWARVSGTASASFASFSTDHRKQGSKRSTAEWGNGSLQGSAANRMSSLSGRNTPETTPTWPRY